MDNLVNSTITAVKENLSGSSNATMPVMPDYISVTSTLLYVIIFIVGIIGNGLVITVVAINKDMRNSTNTFLVNLAVADLLVILICMPPALAEIFSKDQWFFGEVMCKLVPFLEGTASNASVIAMLIIGIERFQAICFPLKLRNNKLFSKTTKLVTIVGLWLFSMLSSAPFLIIAVYRGSRYKDGTPIKVCRLNMVEAWERYFILGTFLVFFVMPFLILAILYIILGKTIAFEHNVFKDATNGRNQKKRVNTTRQVVVMVSIVTILFFVCNLPYRVFSLWVMYAPRGAIQRLGFESYWSLLCFGRIMLYTNSCINPVIYNMVSTKFRRAFNSYLFRRRNTYHSEAGTTYNFYPTGTTIMLKKRSFSVQ